MSDLAKVTLYSCFVCGLVGSVVGMYIAESDIKRDCTKLGHVVLLNQAYVCEASKK